MEIVHIAAECAPLAKVGGLGDVVLGLASAFKKKQHHVSIILPKYKTLNLKEIKNLDFVGEFSSPFEGTLHRNKVWRGESCGIDVILLEPEHPAHFFKRNAIYGFPDDLERFAYFSIAALTYLKSYKKEPDILHIHDWHTSLIAPLVKKKIPFASRVVLTIHNMAYQGVAPKTLFKKIQLEEKALLEEKDPTLINLLKGGIYFSDFITTVSPTYAQEILHIRHHDPLAELLKARKKAFQGILNGIDYSLWNPETDPFLPLHFSKNTLDKKQELQSLVRKRLSLSEQNVPLVGCVTRLVQQKGPELIKQAVFTTLEKGGQFVLVGSASDSEMQAQFDTLKTTLEKTGQAYFEFSYNEELSRLVFAAADLFVIPSIFEPCGLTQLIAMRYGTLPFVRRTGGLADTVRHHVNGFCFNEPTVEALDAALSDTLSVWSDQKELWKKMQRTAMNEDFSWDISGGEYLKIYTTLAC